MKLDGDKLLADLESRVKKLFNYIDSDIGNCNYDSITEKKVEIDSIRRVVRLIDLGDYTIKESD